MAKVEARAGAGVRCAEHTRTYTVLVINVSRET